MLLRPFNKIIIGHIHFSIILIVNFEVNICWGNTENWKCLLNTVPKISKNPGKVLIDFQGSGQIL